MGSDFYVGFFPNVPISSPSLLVFVSTTETEGANFTIESSHPSAIAAGYPLTLSVQHGEVVQINVPNELIVLSSEEAHRNKALHLVVDDGKKVSVVGFNDNLESSDGFLALPCDNMRQDVFSRFEYMVLSGFQQGDPDDLPLHSSFMIIPCEADTKVTIYPSQTVTFTFGDIFVNPLQAGPGGSSTFTAEAGQTILIELLEDLSGSIVRSDKPMVVYIGHQCADVPEFFPDCDHLVEQVPPSISWGHTFFLAPLAYRESGDLYRVGTVEDGTQINVTCTTPGSDGPQAIDLAENGQLNRGEWTEFNTSSNTANETGWIADFCCLESNNPVLVVQYSQGNSVDSMWKNGSNIGDPFMIVVPPLTQFTNNYRITSVSGTGGPFSLRYANIAVHSSFGTNVTLSWNGTTTSLENGWSPFYCSSGAVCGWGTQVAIGENTTLISHDEPGAAIGVSTYGFQVSNAYGYPLGMELTPLGIPNILHPFDTHFYSYLRICHHGVCSLVQVW